ncbi:MAG TPA: DUF2058 family protein [Rudaea sp.]|nr:DUF2058 family protein [Rudaea sp.]
MSESLRDQLLKSGLAKALKPAPNPSRKLADKPSQKSVSKPVVQRRQGPASRQRKATGGDAAELDLARAYALRARQEKQDRVREQAEAERAAREKKERKLKLTSLLGDKALNAADADVPRHFPHGNKIRRIYCTKQQLVQLNRGDLAVVQLLGRYLLVTRELGMQAHAIHAESLVLLCDPDAPNEDDVPADLVW